ncbi:MAG: hypothetical protein KGI78_02995 [Patescibacteria group bacterium]|nr:hypothetical protein [Patescibacteria group bacterium]MDE1944028.1 hypothetical protein [Patescibacteria group bacterium]MDE2057796.1 hypothetical protein [Patescibacteria group bacterium]
MTTSWYQENSTLTQVGGVAVTIHWPSSIDIGLYSSTAGWTEGIIDGESYTGLRFEDIFKTYFPLTPDRW